MPITRVLYRGMDPGSRKIGRFKWKRIEEIHTFLLTTVR